MKEYKFKLTPAYCLYNGVAVLEQKGTQIRFLIENDKDLILKQRLKNAFAQFLEYAVKQKDCPELYRRLPLVEFEKGNRKVLRKIVSDLYQTEGLSENEEIKTSNESSDREAAAVLLLDKILEDGRLKNATDIHIENNLVRYRVFGRIENGMELISDRAEELIQRIKLLSGMNLLERHKSQDGHFIYGRNNPVFVRVSTMSVISKGMESCESVVLRLLDTSRIPLNLEKLGFNSLQLEKIEELCQKKNGLVLVSGPTGSGKSTTAASILMEIVKLKGGGVKIISLEDPPEYVLPGVCQINLDEKDEKGFEKALKHIFRQDPDVIMIGEIRDAVTARTALRAALTGHLVFGTLHSSGAAASFFRLKDLGVDSRILSSLLRGVISQELEYDKNNVSLLSDVSIPSFDFSLLADKALSQGELEELFNHYQNYGDLLSRSVEKMRKRLLPVINHKKSEKAGGADV